jgi:hypothetical protein
LSGRHTENNKLFLSILQSQGTLTEGKATRTYQFILAHFYAENNIDVCHGGGQVY